MGVAIHYGVYELYALESIAVLAKPDSFMRSHEMWQRDFEEYRKRFLDAFELAVFDYSLLACCGESRHAKAKSAFYNPNFSVSGSRRDSYDTAKHHFSSDSLVKHVNLVFDPKYNSWGGTGGYGGVPWFNIADGIANRYNYGSKLGFIDHMVDLSHNGGAYFDKEETGIFYMPEKDGYRAFLDTKAHQSPDHTLGCCFVSDKLKQLIDRGNTLGILSDIVVGTKSLDGGTTKGDADSAVEFILRREPIAWGIRPLKLEYKATGFYVERFHELERYLSEMYPVGELKLHPKHNIPMDVFNAFANAIGKWKDMGHYQKDCDCKVCSALTSHLYPKPQPKPQSKPQPSIASSTHEVYDSIVEDYETIGDDRHVQKKTA